MRSMPTSKYASICFLDASSRILSHLNQKLWFVEPDVLLIIPTSLGGVAAALSARSRD